MNNLQPSCWLMSCTFTKVGLIRAAIQRADVIDLVYDSIKILLRAAVDILFSMSLQNSLLAIRYSIHSCSLFLSFSLRHSFHSVFDIQLIKSSVLVIQFLLSSKAHLKISCSLFVIQFTHFIIIPLQQICNSYFTVYPTPRPAKKSEYPLPINGDITNFQVTPPSACWNRYPILGMTYPKFRVEMSRPKIFLSSPVLK
jgi:hypothetical protein